MSLITLLDHPKGKLVSAGNDANFVVSSSTYTNPNIFDYQYLANIVVNGNIVATQTAFPDSNYGYGWFNVRGVIPSFISYDFPFVPSTSSLFYPASNSFCTASLQFGEIYTTQNGLFSQSLNLTSSTTHVFFNGSLSNTDQILTNLDDYLMSPVSGSDKKFFSSGSNSLTTYTDMKGYLTFYNTSSAACYIDIGTYDSNNNLIGFYSIPNNYSASVGMQMVGVGAWNLINYSGSFLNNAFNPTVLLIDSAGQFIVNSGGQNILTGGGITGSNTIINSSVAKYTVELTNSSPLQGISETYIYNIGDASGRWQNYTYNCYFLNDRGGFEAYKFQRKNQTSITKTVSSFNKTPGTLLSNGKVQYNTYDRQETNYFTALEEKIEVNSDWLSNIDCLALIKNLFSSPIVYLEDINGVIIAVNVDTKDYTINNSTIKKMNNVRFVMKTSTVDYRQQF